MLGSHFEPIYIKPKKICLISGNVPGEILLVTHAPAKSNVHLLQSSIFATKESICYIQQHIKYTLSRTKI